jgi:hypothetical protein
MSGCASTQIHDFCYGVSTRPPITKHDLKTISDPLHKWLDSVNAVWGKICI